MSEQMTETFQADHDDARPSWLPDKFKTAEAMASAYYELERRLTGMAEQVKELQQQQPLSDELAAEELDVLQAAEPYAQAVMTEVQNSPKVQEQRTLLDATSNLDAMQILAAAVNQARTQVDHQVGQAVGAIPDQQTITANLSQQGLGLLAATHPGFTEESQKMIATELERNPAVLQMVEAAHLTNDPATVATALSGALASAQQREQIDQGREWAQQMKMNAQTLTGGVGRPSPQSPEQAEWQRIMAAGKPAGGY